MRNFFIHLGYMFSVMLAGFVTGVGAYFVYVPIVWTITYSHTWEDIVICTIMVLIMGGMVYAGYASGRVFIEMWVDHTKDTHTQQYCQNQDYWHWYGRGFSYTYEEAFGYTPNMYYRQEMGL